jgi:hypothetical protein
VAATPYQDRTSHRLEIARLTWRTSTLIVVRPLYCKQRKRIAELYEVEVLITGASATPGRKIRQQQAVPILRDLKIGSKPSAAASHPRTVWQRRCNTP